jgi:hypothetical protein
LGVISLVLSTSVLFSSRWEPEGQLLSVAQNLLIWAIRCLEDPWQRTMYRSGCNGILLGSGVDQANYALMLTTGCG